MTFFQLRYFTSIIVVWGIGIKYSPVPRINIGINFFRNITVKNVQKFIKFVCYKGNVKFDDIYDLFEWRYLKIAKNLLIFLKFFLISWNSTEFLLNVFQNYQTVTKFSVACNCIKLQLLSKYESVKFLLFEWVIRLFTDSSANNIFFTTKSVNCY